MTDLFSVLADETRRDIVTLLRKVKGAAGEMSVGEMVELLGITQPTVSKHLKVLRDAGLVRVREEGQHRFYRADESPLHSVMEWLGVQSQLGPGGADEPLIDLRILGKATGGLVNDVMTRVRSVIDGVTK